MTYRVVAELVPATSDVNAQSKSNRGGRGVRASVQPANATCWLSREPSDARLRQRYKGLQGPCRTRAIGLSAGLGFKLLVARRAATGSGRWELHAEHFCAWQRA